MLDVKLKLRPGHTSERTWKGPAALRQLVWNVTYACNYACTVCFTDAGRRRGDELDTAEARRLIASAREAGVRDIIVSGGEPFARPDMVGLLVEMARHGISARIASNGSLVTEEILRRLKAETLVSSFQISLDTLEPARYAALHGCRAEMLDRALDATRRIKAAGFHATISARVTPATLADLPALVELARREGWATVTLHLPVHTRRVRDAGPADADLLASLEPVFEAFLSADHWLVETYIPWAPLHPLLRRLAERVRFVHRGCSAGRDRLTVSPSGMLSPCVCLDVPAAYLGSVREVDLPEAFESPALREGFRLRRLNGECAACPAADSCRGGCRASALALTGRLDGEDLGCPARRRA